MKMKPFAPLLALTIVATAMNAQAHEPKEHMKDAEKPDCSAMKDMDHSKMDMNDPVMQAMMKKCMKDMHHGKDKNESDLEHSHDDNESEDEHAEHQH